MRLLLTLALIFTLFNLSYGQNCGSTLIGTDRTNGGNTLVEFDPSTGTFVDLFDLDPTSNSFYGIVVSGQYCYINREFNSPTQNFLYCVDIETGIYNPNFPVEISDNALFQANSCDMTLFGLDRDNDGSVELVSIDLESGVTSTISPNPIPFDLPIPQADAGQIASSALVGNTYYYTAMQNTQGIFEPIISCVDITSGELIGNFSLPNNAVFDEFVIDEATGLLYGLFVGNGGTFFGSFDPSTGTFTTISTAPLNAPLGGNPTIVGTNYCYLAVTPVGKGSLVTEFTCLDLATGEVSINLPDIGTLELSGFDTNCTCPDTMVGMVIPTTSEWGLIILALLLLIFSTYSIRQLSAYGTKQTRKVEL